jgi:Asp-tRNA(Asn)/Glu-tRNA(Gln) amidotransferase A subunit family amidase
MAQDIAFLSAAETTAAIKTRQVSPVEVVQAYLARIDRLDAQLRAYITVLRDEALAAARRAEQEVMRDGNLGPLFGVPVAVKDQFWTKGIRTTNGSRVFRHFVPHEDATVVARLAQAGTILLGKLNMSELAMGGTQQPRMASRVTPGIWSVLRASPAPVPVWRWRRICVQRR